MPIDSLDDWWFRCTGTKLIHVPPPPDREKLDAALKRMERHDDLDTSTIRCGCGASFTWAMELDALDAFLRRHVACLESGR